LERQDSSEDLQDYATTMNLYSAPAFSATAPGDANKNVVSGSLIWSPDGHDIFYGVSRSGTMFDGEYSRIWSSARDGSDPHPLFPDSLDRPFRFLQFLGWMDPHTIVYSGYAGGGHSDIEEYNILKNDVLVSDTVQGSQKPIHSGYIPVVSCARFCTTCVVTSSFTASQSFYETYYTCQSDQGHARPFLRPETYEPTIDTLFQDWQAGTNNMLILAQGEISDTPVSRLLLWNVDTDKVTSLAPGGLFGKFSPNGKLLAYITSGPSDHYAEKNPQNLPVDPIVSGDKHYLQIMNINTRQMIMRVLVKAHVMNTALSVSGWDTTEPDELSFSPDGRYISFVTDGSITLKDAHFPTEVSIADTSTVYLNILDLQEEKLAQSLPLEGYGKYTYPNLLWAPTSRKFVYQDASENWQLFELSNNTIFPITQSNGDQLISPAWSYDGSYLSFASQYYMITDPMKTYILSSGK
jgi:Tol biopolymer transport system component